MTFVPGDYGSPTPGNVTTIDPGTAAMAAGLPLLDTAASIHNTERTIKANRRMAEYAYAKDLEMWNRMNLYNHPTQQMARLREAGLNPNLVYGSKQVVGNTQGQMPRYNRPTFQYDYEAPDIMGTLSQWHDVRVKQAQHDNVRANVLNKQADTAIKAAQLPGVVSESARKEIGRRIMANTEQWTTEGEKYRSDYWRKKAAREGHQAVRAEAESTIARITKEFKQWGIAPQDPLPLRLMFRGLINSGLPAEDINEQLQEWRQGQPRIVTGKH